MRRQAGRVVAAVAVVGAVVSGCGGPSQVGSAVIIGTDAVSLETVQSQLDVALSNTEQVAQLTAQGGGPADVARSIVTGAILHNLLTRRAAQEGIVVTDAQLAAELPDSGADDAARLRVRDALIAAELARRSVGGLSATFDLVAVTSRADAEETAQVLAAGGPAAEALFTDPQTSAKGTTIQAVTAPADAASVLFGTAVGSVVAFQPSPQQSTWIVLRVTDRRTDAPFVPAAVTAISQAQLVAIGERLLQLTAAELGIRVNPRYGVWDPIALRVVAEDQRTGTILPPSPAAAG